MRWLHLTSEATQQQVFLESSSKSKTLPTAYRSTEDPE